MLRVLAVAMLAMLVSLPSSAREGFEFLAQRKTEFGDNRIVIKVGRELGLFSAISINLKEGNLVVYDFEVTYENGERERIAVDERLQGNGSSAGPFDLRGSRRFIKDITVNCRSRRRDAGIPATFNLWGKSEGDRGLQPGWEMVETREYDLDDSTVVLPIGRREGAFTALQLRALDHSVRIRRATIVLANGQEEEVRISDKLDPGELSGVIDISGRSRRVEKVIVTLVPQRRGQTARLQLLGQADNRGDWRDRDRGGYGRDRDDGPRNRGLTDRVPAGWVLFGAQSVGFGADRDVIRVGKEVGLFDLISLRVLENDIFLREITVVYGNGERDRREVRAELPANSRTEPLRLKGDRFIQEIELVYQSRPDRRGQQAVVEVYGEYAEAWRNDASRRRGHNDGWLLLGVQRVTSLTTDRDSFVVGESFGRFKSLRIVARRNDVRVLGMRVTYRSGEVEEFPIYGKLSEGQATEAIDLRGNARGIEKVDLVYRAPLNLLNLKGSGIVELWGQQ